MNRGPIALLDVNFLDMNMVDTRSYWILADFSMAEIMLNVKSTTHLFYSPNPYEVDKSKHMTRPFGAKSSTPEGLPRQQQSCTVQQV